MSEPNEIDALLRESMGSAPPPTLPPTFSQRVTERLRPRAPSARARRALRLYALAAVVISVAVMRGLNVEWSLIAASLAVTAAIAAILRSRLR